MTKAELATLLRDVNVEALSEASGVSTKTIYRLRTGRRGTTLDTVEKLVAGVAKVRRWVAGTAIERAA